LKEHVFYLINSGQLEQLFYEEKKQVLLRSLA